MRKGFVLFFLLSSFLFSVLLSPSSVFCGGNTTIKKYQTAKKILYNIIYNGHQFTFYCNFPYAKDKSVDLPSGFVLPDRLDRANKVNTEHIVPVDNFGKTFPEWHEGHRACESKGKPFKGRKCLELVSQEFKLMESDLYNLYPSLIAANTLRGNLNFQMLGSQAPLPFGPSCPMRMQNRHIEPPEHARGPIARTYLYMEDAYPRYRMSEQQRKLMEAWDREYPPSSWECERARRIRKVQGNPNVFVERGCK